MPERAHDLPVAQRDSGETDAAAPTHRAPRRSRRASTPPPPGSDPTPAPAAPLHTLTENDARLKAEKPPHY